jgi:hypothetical protein
MAVADPLGIPLLGHFGLLDTLNHALTTAGSYASVLARGGATPEDVVALREALARADAVSSLARDALLAGATREQQLGTEAADPMEREHWLGRHAAQAWTEAEAEVLRRIGHT